MSSPVIPAASTASKGSQAKGKSVVAAVRDGAQSLGRRVRSVLSSKTSSNAHGPDSDDDRPPVYQRHSSGHLPGAPGVSIDYSYTLNPVMSYRVMDTGNYSSSTKGASEGHANLVVGSDRHTITFRERTSLIEKHLRELDQLTTAEPAGGYPLHSVQSFKVAQLVKTIGALSDVKVPTHASREYMEKIQGLLAIRDRMAEMEQTLATGRACGATSQPPRGSAPSNM